MQLHLNNFIRKIQTTDFKLQNTYFNQEIVFLVCFLKLVLQEVKNNN